MTDAEITIQKEYDDTMKMVDPPSINEDCMALAKEWIDKNASRYYFLKSGKYAEYNAAVGAVLGAKAAEWVEQCENDPAAYIKHYTNDDLMNERMSEICRADPQNLPQGSCDNWRKERGDLKR